MTVRSICKAEEAFSSFLPAQGELPDSIQWMPPGRHTITPSINDKPARFEMNVTPELASEFNGLLQQIRAKAAQGEGDEPYIDFNHRDDERAAEVTELYWGGTDPRTGGIRARVKWSAAGESAVLGRTYRRFSPQWALDPDTFEPIGLTANLGGLVNRAAFKTIAPVIAKDAGAATQTTKTTMTKEEFEAALAAGLKPIGDRLNTLEGRFPAADRSAATAAAATANPDITKIVGEAVTAAVKPFADKLTTMEANTAKASSRNAIQPHINRGAIAPQDEKTITFWTNAYIADAAGAEAQMARLPGAKLGRTVVAHASAGGNADVAAFDSGNQFIAKAREHGKALGLKTDPECMAAFARTPEGKAMYEQNRDNYLTASAKN